MSKKTGRPDHGSFTIQSPQESVMLVQLHERAQKNTQKPGLAWGRIEAKRTLEGRTQKGFKVYRVDLNTSRVTITEEWDGVESARKTVPLGSYDDTREMPAGPTAPPEPGSPEPMFYRWPFRSADLLPEDELREWAMARAEEDVMGISVLPRRIRLFGEGFMEVVGLPHPLAANLAPGTGATLKALWSRPGVERRLVEGWFGSVDGRGTAWILEPGKDGAWWLAMRTFERRPGMIGMWTSAWSQRAGHGVKDLSSSLRPVLEPPPGERPIDVGKPKEPEPPEIGMFAGALQPHEEVPVTAEAVADRIGREWEGNLPLGRTPEGTIVTVFRGREFETWKLEGVFPMGIDDMIRAVCARGETPTSVAVVHMGVVPMEGEVYRALLTDGEAQGERWTRVFVIRMAPDGTILGHRIAIRKHGQVGDDGWIGVAPITEMDLFVLGAGEA
ncbi:MAG: hypothetical protein ACOZNI_09040 [Myxococcota bacterium]